MSTTTRETARAVIYDRVSEADPESQAAHVDHCRRFCDLKGWTIVEEATDVASGFSRTVRRPGWDRVEALVRAEKVDAVVVFATSRAGRNVVRFASFIQDCQDHGVVFASASEGGIDTSGMFGPVILTLLSGLAQMESAVKRERALLGEAKHKRERTFRGGNLPFGFRVEAGQVLVDDLEGTMIRDAVRDVANGTSLEAVARRWNDAGVLTHPGNGRTSGSRWTGSHVRAVLGAERNVDAGVVTATDRRRVVEVFDARRTGRVPDRYLLAGLVRCAVHDRPMRGRQGKYACGYDEKKKVHLSIRRAALDALVHRVAERREQDHPFQAQDLQDPSDDLVVERERIVAELEALGDSDLSEHVIRGRERKLLRALDAVEAKIEKAAPRPMNFKEQRAAKHGATEGEFVRRYVHRVMVEPASKPGARFDPSRVQVTYAGGGVASAAEIVAAWDDMVRLARADMEDAQQVAELRK